MRKMKNIIKNENDLLNPYSEALCPPPPQLSGNVQIKTLIFSWCLPSLHWMLNYELFFQYTKQPHLRLAWLVSSQQMPPWFCLSSTGDNSQSSIHLGPPQSPHSDSQLGPVAVTLGWTWGRFQQMTTGLHYLRLNESTEYLPPRTATDVKIIHKSALWIILLEMWGGRL